MDRIQKEISIFCLGFYEEDREERKHRQGMYGLTWQLCRQTPRTGFLCCIPSRWALRRESRCVDARKSKISVIVCRSSLTEVSACCGNF